MNRKAVLLLGMLGIFLLVLPGITNAYVLSVATLILFFAYTGQAWNVMMGFAGQLSLGHSLYVGVAAYAAAGLFFHYGIGPWAGLWLAILLCVLLGMLIGFLAFRFGISGVYFALLTIAFAEFTRIGFDHLDWTRRPGRPVHQGRAARSDRPAQLPRPAGDVLLRHAAAGGRLPSSAAISCSSRRPATTGRRSARTRKRRRRSASTPSAGRCWRWR